MQRSSFLLPADLYVHRFFSSSHYYLIKIHNIFIFILNRYFLLTSLLMRRILLPKDNGRISYHLSFLSFLRDAFPVILCLTAGFSTYGLQGGSHMINTVDRVYRLMEQRGLSLYRLCRMSGVNYSTISTARRRKGQLGFETVDRVCSALGISLSEFFSESEKGDDTGT